MTTILATTRSRRFRPVLATYAAFAAVTALTLGTLTGCASEPEPTPSATPAFASEAEAFAAAEEVYRAYNEALNGRREDIGDITDPQDFLAGSALEADIQGKNQLDAAGLQTRGDAEIESFVGKHARVTGLLGTVTAIVCINASQVSVVNDLGEDVTPVERGDIVALQVTFVGTTQKMVISEEESAGPEAC